MARPREFDTDEALGKAMDLFWQDGYERASLTNLLDAMEIQRSSFYNSFGDKRHVFIMALKRYMKSVNEDWIIKILDESDDGVSGIATIFNGYVTLFTHDKECKGCLLVNTTVELAPHDEEIATLIADNQKLVEEAFIRALSRAQQQGLISQDLNLQSTVSFLMTTLSGMRVLGRQTYEPEPFKAVVDIALSILQKP